MTTASVYRRANTFPLLDPDVVTYGDTRWPAMDNTRPPVGLNGRVMPIFDPADGLI